MSKSNNRVADACIRERYKTMKKLNRADSLYTSSIASVFVTLFCCAADLTVLKSAWNLVQTESAVLVWILASACAVCLDVPLALAGVALKGCHQRVVKKSVAALTVILAVLVFLVVFAFCFWFRYESRELMFDVGTGTGVMNSLGGTVTLPTISNEDKVIEIAALFNAVIPLATSVAAFCFSYFTANPLGKKILKLERAIFDKEEKISELKTIASYRDALYDHKDFLIERENDLYQQFIDSCNAQALKRKQESRLAVAQALGNPGDTIAVTESGFKLNESSEDKFNSDVNLKNRI